LAGGIMVKGTDTVKVRFLKINIPIESIMSALKFLKYHTRVSSFSDAMTLIHFKDLTREESEHVSMLVTLWRAWKDGEIEPPIDIEAVFSEIEI